MKKNHNVSYLVILAIFIGVLACQKIVVPIQKPDQPAKTDSVQTHQDSSPVHHDTIPVKHDSVKPAKVDTPAAPVPFPQTAPTSSCPVLPIYGDSI
ncbi:MAG TPA: hypothetical protein VE035_08370, partial [Puia sp.]|nr:hypothetical protein [Puia sp.]